VRTTFQSTNYPLEQGFSTFFVLRLHFENIFLCNPIDG